MGLPKGVALRRLWCEGGDLCILIESSGVNRRGALDSFPINEYLEGVSQNDTY